MQKFKTLLTVIGAVTILVLAANSAVYAATGGKFILGQTNKANKASVLKRTTSGTALSLVTKSSSNAPLATNGRGKVTNLNADSVDGVDSSALKNNVRVFNGVISPSVLSYNKELALPAGRYVISWNAYLLGGSGDSECYVRTHSPTDTNLAYTADETSTSTNPAMSGTGMIVQDATHLNEFHCDSDSNFSTYSLEPIQILATKIDSVVSMSNLRTAPNGSRVAK